MKILKYKIVYNWLLGIFTATIIAVGTYYITDLLKEVPPSEVTVRDWGEYTHRSVWVEKPHNIYFEGQIIIAKTQGKSLKNCILNVKFGNGGLTYDRHFVTNQQEHGIDYEKVDLDDFFYNFNKKGHIGKAMYVREFNLDTFDRKTILVKLAAIAPVGEVDPLVFSVNCEDYISEQFSFKFTNG